MNRQHSGSRSDERGIARALSGLASAMVLIAAMIGLPWLFLAVAGSPIPDQIPGWNQITSTLSRRDDGTLLLGFIKYLAWTLWLLWAALLLLEVLARVRGRAAPRIPGLEGPQRLAALLIASLGAALIGTTASLSRSTALPASSPSLSASAPPHAMSAAASLNEAVPVHLNIPARSSAARTHQELVHFSYDSADLSGQAREHLIQAARDIGDHADPSRPIRVVGHTDSRGPAAYNKRLSVQRARAVREVLGQLVPHDFRYEVSGKGESEPLAAETRPSGGDDPAARAHNRRVEITYTLRQATPPRPAPNRPPHHPGSDGGGTPPADSPPSTPSAAISPATPEPTATPQSPTPAPSHDQPDTTSPTHAPTTVNLPSGAVVGFSFAAGVGTALAVSRLHRRRRRQAPRNGPDIRTHEPEATPVVRRLRRADLTARENGHSDPAQAATGNDVLHLFPLTSSGQIVLGVRDDEEVTVPIGGLVIGLAGPGGPDTARALILTLLMHSGDHDVEIIIPRHDAARLFAISPDDVTELADSVRALRVVSDLGAALRVLESERIHRARLLDTATGGQDLAAVRDADPTEPLPRLVLVATPDTEYQRRLEALTAAAADYDMAVIVLGEHPAGATVRIDNGGHAAAAADGDAEPWQGLRLFHLTTGDAHQVLDVIRSAHGAPEPDPDFRPADEAVDPDRTPAPPPPVLEESDTERPVHLHVLGLPIVKVAGRELETGIRGKGRELLSYLAVHADGATRDAILAAIWPDVDHRRAVMRFHAALHDVRRTLRRATELADKDFIVVLADRYRIDPELVSVDLWRFHTALHQASRADDDRSRRAALLQEAADAYEGHLIAETTYEQAYEWIEPEREALRRQAVDALIHLAGLYESDEPERSLTVLERARSLDRYAEEIYQRIMKLQARLGRPDAIRRTYRLLESALEELNVDPSQDTQQLLWRLLHPHGRSQTGRR
jgi:outer membrane protein OmpA-like peptidoglycan-associated protein/DNA-binding SARP family transcriptional activator